MNSACLCGAKGEVPCGIEMELADTPDYEVRADFAPLDPRNEHTHPEDFGPPEWAGVA